MSQDVLSEVLRAVRLKGAVFFSVSCSDPWVAESPPSCEVAPYLMPGVEHVIEYHVVARGRCYGGLADEPLLELDEGDILVYPQGDANIMASAQGMRGIRDASSKRDVLAQRLPLLMSLGDGEQESAQVVCGFLGCDARPFNPLLANLPRMMHVRGAGKEGVLAQLVQMAVAESRDATPGSECMLSRLCELMFIDVVRRYIATLPEDKTGWLSGLRDPLVGRALAAVHGAPKEAWTLESLARRVATSRSVLAERFAQVVGVPPMQYLAQWRMQLAASLLTGSTLSVSEVAEQVGYGSEAALSRAFKRSVGVAPALYRRAQQTRTHVNALPQP